jgi:thiol-disulfide isomerase/thioredoxin
VRRRLVIPVACLLLFAAADAVTRSMRRTAAEAAPVASPWLTRPFALADFPATDLDGRDQSPAQWRGKVAVVNFWATWCGPCRVEIPDLMALQRRHAADLVVLGIAQDESPAEDIRRFVAALGVNYPVVIGRWEIEAAFSEVLALPTTYLVDRSGRVVAHYLGQFDAKSFERDVERLVADRSVARAEVRSVDASAHR